MLKTRRCVGVALGAQDKSASEWTGKEQGNKEEPYEQKDHLPV